MSNASGSNGYGSVSEKFLTKFGGLIQGTVSGFDRLRLRGTLRHLYQPTVMEAYLNACRVLIKDFGKFAERITNQVKAAAYQTAAKAQRPLHYLNSSQVSKEDLARSIAQKDGIKGGLITVLSCVEPCMSYTVRGDRQSKEIHMALEPRKCTHFYYYYLHPLLGFMHVRVQSWFPFMINVCLHGREWLARQMDQSGLAYRKKGNGFVWVEDWARAQLLMDQQVQTDWGKLLGQLLDESLPLHREICQPIHQQYYGSAAESEFATDLVFKDAKTLAKLYPQFIRHGMSSFASPDVMRFLGRAVPETTGTVNRHFKGEVISDIKRRPEGVRIKHSVNGNSIKLYDKQGQIMRVETTILNPLEFRVYRASEGDREQKLGWKTLRRGLADLPRRAEVSLAANNRYLSALASVSGTTPLHKLVEKVCRPVTKDGRRARALNPWSLQDGLLLETISQGEFAINGLRNRDLRAVLFSGEAAPKEEKRRAAAVTRKLGLLRMHGLIRKVSGTHRYVVTEQGREMITALLAARQADVTQLTKLAA